MKKTIKTGVSLLALSLAGAALAQVVTDTSDIDQDRNGHNATVFQNQP